MMNYRKLFNSGALFLFMMMTVSCSKSEDEAAPTAEGYETTFEVTDAPIDNANVKGAFVTITNVKVNGEVMPNFQPTKVDLLALQGGATEAIGTMNLESGMTSSIVLELSTEAMANYILLEGDEKKELVAESGEIVLTESAEVLASDDNVIVLDFDLRKMIVADAASNDFDFVSNTELQSSIRAVNEANSGRIEGQVSDAGDAAGKIVVYAYEEGTYTESEATTSSEGKVRFSNAVTSSVVSEVDSSYSLNFLKEGEYELHFASYKENAEGEAVFEGMLEVQAAAGLGLDIFGFTLDANSETQIDVAVVGLVQ